MRSAAIAVTLCGFLLNVGFAQVKPTTLQPTRLEAFAGRPTAKVTWFSEVGKIVSEEASVTVTALMIKDAGQPSNQMCGIRIDLENPNARDQVYLEQAKLDAVRKALEEIESGIENFRKEPADTPLRYRGAAEFWHPHLKVHTLSAAYYIAPNSSGLSLSAYKGQEFRFRNHRPSGLANAIGKAMDELKQRCGS